MYIVLWAVVCVHHKLWYLDLSGLPYGIVNLWSLNCLQVAVNCYFSTRGQKGNIVPGPTEVISLYSLLIWPP